VTSPDPDRDLIPGLKAGERAAFAALLDRHERRIYNLALRLLGGDTGEAEDATQDIFIEVHRAVRGFRGGARLDTWMHRIAVNVCLQRRRRRRLETVELPDDGRSAGPEGDPFRAAARTELSGRIEREVGRLPEIQQEVVLLHGMQGLTYAEVAQVLDCPVGTVKSRLSAAFRSLREALAPYVLAETPAEPARVEVSR
jgi:RNA polymerase sigma-70 factor (ECF subfamily)